MEALGNYLKAYRTGRGWTQPQMADYLGVGYRTYQDMERTGIIAKAPEYLRITDLTGYNKKESAQISAYPESKDANNFVSEPAETSYYSKRREKKNAPTGNYLVPFMSLKAQAGFVHAMNPDEYVETLDKYALPPGIDYRGAIWRYWEVEGDSMEPLFRSGDIILTSMVPQMDWENIRDYYLYVVATRERIMFKRLFNKDENNWVLISENEGLYEQKLLPIKDVRELWVYRRSIVNKAPPTKRFEIKV